MTGGVRPAIQLEPTFTYEEVAAATGFSLSFVRREAGEGHLKHRPQGRRMVCTQRHVDNWLQDLEERQEDKRAARVTRRDQKGRAQPKPRRKPVKAYTPQADSDILANLGITKE